MRVDRLKRILEHILLGAGATSVAGCCDLTGAGKYPDWYSYTIVLPSPAVAAAAREGTDGSLDETTCTAACSGRPACRFATARVTWKAEAGSIQCHEKAPPGVVVGRVYPRPRPEHLDTTGSIDMDGRYFVGTPKLCAELCDPGVESCDILPAVAPPPPPSMRFIVCEQNNEGQCPTPAWLRMPAGRVPPGANLEGEIARTPGDFFAEVSSLEALSVKAFRHCARSLTKLGAPAAFALAARRAARDEIRHARLTRRLAARFGRERIARQQWTAKPHTLLSFAIENAEEGCAGETLGALLAMHQASFAADAEVRRTMTSIARDELGHAALAWSIHAWCLSRLPYRERVQVMEALRAAQDRWVRSPAAFPAAVVNTTGIPSANRARELARGLRASLRPRHLATAGRGPPSCKACSDSL
jgi:hypothetical protein